MALHSLIVAKHEQLYHKGFSIPCFGDFPGMCARELSMQNEQLGDIIGNIISMS